MRIWLKITALFLAFSALSASSFASPPGAYEISAKLSHAGKSFAAPSTKVRAGEPATLAVSGPDGYKLTLTVTDLAADRIQVVTALVSPRGSIGPTIVVRPDEAASVSIGDLGIELVVSRSGG